MRTSRHTATHAPIRITFCVREGQGGGGKHKMTIQWMWWEMNENQVEEAG